MKNIVKVLAVILAFAMMAMFVTSCGSTVPADDTGSKISSDKHDHDDEEDVKDDEEDETEEVEEDEEDSAESSYTLFTTVEEYFESEIGKKEIDATKESFDGVLDIEVYAEGNDMYYDYSYLTQYDDSALETLKKSLESGLESQASTFESVVTTMEAAVDGEVTLTVIYRNADKTVITERSYEN